MLVTKDNISGSFLDEIVQAEKLTDESYSRLWFNIPYLPNKKMKKIKQKSNYSTVSWQSHTHHTPHDFRNSWTKIYLMEDIAFFKKLLNK